MALRHVLQPNSRFAVAKPKGGYPRTRSTAPSKQGKMSKRWASTGHPSSECVTIQLQPLTFTKHLKEEVLRMDPNTADVCQVEERHGLSVAGYLRIATVLALGYVLLAAREYGLLHFP